MKPLTLDNAMELYRIIGKHVPDSDEVDTPIDFIGKIIENAKQSSEPGAYTDALVLVSGKSLIELSEMPSEQRLELFIDGMYENKIIQLKTFCDMMGFNHG